jgi:hypothetical protein
MDVFVSLPMLMNQFGPDMSEVFMWTTFSKSNARLHCFRTVKLLQVPTKFKLDLMWLPNDIWNCLQFFTPQMMGGNHVTAVF